MQHLTKRIAGVWLLWQSAQRTPLNYTELQLTAVTGCGTVGREGGERNAYANGAAPGTAIQAVDLAGTNPHTSTDYSTVVEESTSTVIDERESPIT